METGEGIDMGRKRSDTPGRGKSEPHESAGLRSRAEIRPAEKGPAEMRPADLERLVHELQAHRIELEMQNEELKRVQSEIAKSRQKYIDLYDFAPVGYFSFDRNGVITEANLTGASLVGIERSRLVGKPFSLFVSRQHRDTFFTHRRKTQKTGRTERCELLVQRKDGSLVPVLMESVTAADKAGNVIIRSAVMDITEARDELEQRVRERTEELRRQAELLELSHEAILVRDLDNRIIFWSRGASETYGWTKAEALGNVAHVLLKIESSLFEDLTAGLMEKGRWEGEQVHTRKDGAQITILSRQALQRDETSRPIAIFEINIDVTSERGLEEHLRQAQKMEAIGTLAGGIAHDFNNMLAVIIGNAELALDDISGNEGPVRNIEQILKASGRARDLVKQILTFSPKKEQEKNALHLTPLVEETCKLLRSSLPGAVRMKLDLRAASDTVIGDPTQLQQVLMNLCTNAAHAMRERGGILLISLADVACTRPDKMPEADMTPGIYVKLGVKDTGTGMAENVQKRMFEPFFTTKETGQGTGMGLAVVYGVVKDHGGAISVQSKMGEGSTFTIFLPCADAAAKEGQEETFRPSS
jgi:PAS domain S-box-containing protein